MRGKVLDSAPIYSDQCLLWLREAVKYAADTDESSSLVSSVRSPLYASSDDDDDATAEDKSDDSQSTSSDLASADEEEVKDKVINDVDATAQQLPAVQPVPNQTKPRTKRNKSEIDQYQRDLLIRRHADTVPCISFDMLPNNNGSTTTTTTTTTIEIPACWLSKDDLRCDSRTVQSRSYLTLSDALRTKELPVVVLFIRSGRFAGAVFQHDRAIVHRTSVRYTVRKGQGKAQSSQDAVRKAKSIGAQLRRQGEISLQQDIATALSDWTDYICRAAVLLLSVPRTMQKQLFDNTAIMTKDDPRIRHIPLDLGRPTYENVCLIYSILTLVTIREKIAIPDDETPSLRNEDDVRHDPLSKVGGTLQTIVEQQNEEVEHSQQQQDIVPLSDLHIAAQNGDVDAIHRILEESWTTATTNSSSEDTTALPPTSSSMVVDQVAGPLYMTPLHYAAESATSTTQQPSPVDPSVAAHCVRVLLELGRANPCCLDRRRRVPYYLASHDVIRDAFRISRAILGEEYCAWDKDAKVGPPLTQDAIQIKNDKEAEKRRKKRAKQKEKKARDKAEQKEAEDRKIEAEERLKREEEAKRIRDGLAPKKKTGAGGACDYCQVVCVGQKRANMLKRLSYAYCSTDCVQKHKRELMAQAATARLGGGA